MLIRCKECGKEISDKATTCIHCGAPLQKQVDNKQTVHVEETDKEIKVVQLVSTALFIIGMLGVFFTEYFNFFAVVMFIGCVMIIYNGFKAWWRYK